MRYESWLDSGYILKIEVMGFVCGEKMGCEKRRGDKVSFMFFGLKNRKGEVVIY